MRWDTHKKLETAWAAYLKSVLPGTIKVVRAHSTDALQYPCVVCDAGSGRLMGNEIFAAQKFAGGLGVRVEAVPQLDTAGNVLRTAEDIDTDVVSAVMDAVMVEGLTELLIATGVQGISISQVIPGSGDGEIMIPGEVEDKVFHTGIPWRAIAGPKEE